MDVLNVNISSIQRNGEYNDIYMFGDMNFHISDWDSVNAGIYVNSESIENIQVNRLIDVMSDYYLVQTVNEPTRGLNTLDYVITNNMNCISHNQVIRNHNFSDHNTIIKFMNLKFNQKKKERIFGSLYDTEVPLYDINVENSHELWGQYSDILNRVTWDQVRGKSQNLE